LVFEIVFQASAIPVLLLLISYNKKLLPKHEKLQELSGNLQAVAQEIISGVRVVKSFVKEDYETKRFSDVNNQVYEGNLELVKINSIYHPALDFLSTAVTLIVLLVLRDFNLEVTQGQMVALVGHTGAGKTSVINLLCRFYQPDSGSI